MTLAPPSETVVHPLRFFNQPRDSVETFAKEAQERFDGIHSFIVRPLGKNEVDTALYDAKRSWRLELSMTPAAKSALTHDLQFAAAYSRAIMPVTGSNRVFVDGRATKPAYPPVPQPDGYAALTAVTAGRMMVSAFSAQHSGAEFDDETVAQDAQSPSSQ